MPDRGDRNMNYEALGKRIRQYRKDKGLSQVKLAENAGISPSFLGHIERGSRKAGLETFVNIANAMDVRTDDLLADSLDCYTAWDQRRSMLARELLTVAGKYVAQIDDDKK